MPQPTLYAPVLLPPSSVVGPASGESVTSLPLRMLQELLVLPSDWSRNELEVQCAMAALQNLSMGSPAQLQPEVMDTSGSVATASEAAASEMPSERQERSD